MLVQVQILLTPAPPPHRYRAWKYTVMKVTKASALTLKARSKVDEMQQWTQLTVSVTPENDVADLGPAIV